MYCKTLGSFITLMLLMCLPLGTPLGDPIELGAVSSVFDTRSHGRPVTLMASKGFLGHTEPAAGVVSLIMAVSTLQNLAEFPIMHLRTLNPLITGILAGSSGGVVALPRQGGALPQGRQSFASTGISSFAFQGTNAHAVLQASATAEAATPAVAALTWRQQRQWVLPPAHCLIKHCMTGKQASSVSFACNLLQPALGFLWEHQVMERSLFPGAGYFEMALAAVRTLHGSANLHAAEHCLTDIAIPAPLVLGPSSAATAGLVLTCSLDLTTQAISIASSLQSVHMRGHFSQAQTSHHAACATSASHALMMVLTSDQSPPQLTPAAAQASIAPAVGTAQQDSGFWHHPGRCDSFLQMGQLFLDSSPDSIHVPAGVSCLSMPAKMGTAQFMYGHCQPSGVTLSSDYTLADHQAGSCCLIQGMQAKCLTAAPSRTGEAIAEGAQQHGEVLYETAWLVDSQVSAATDVHSRSGAGLLIGGQTPAMACAHALALLQDSLSRAPQTGLTLTGSGGTVGSSNSTMQVVAGAFRTAAVEVNAPVTVLESSHLQGTHRLHCIATATPLCPECHCYRACICHSKACRTDISVSPGRSSHKAKQSYSIWTRHKHRFWYHLRAKQVHG